MKKKIAVVAVFLCLAAVCYFVLCYMPAFRLKLAAPPMEYFVESIRHAAAIKLLFSLIISALLEGAALLLIQKEKTN